MKYNYGSKKYISARESPLAFELVCLTKDTQFDLFLKVKSGEKYITAVILIEKYL